MALTPKTDEAFLREVDEELRRDQMTSFWTRYGRWLIAAIVLGLAIFAGVLYWRHHKVEQAGVEGERLGAVYDALATNAKAVPKDLPAPAHVDVDGYRATARFLQADQLLAKDDLKGAAAKFAEVAGDTDLPQPLRDLALIRQTSAEFDTLKPDVIAQRMKPLAVKGNAWFGSAGELLAAAHLRNNNPGAARDLFSAIARDDQVPATIRQRAVQMAGAMGVDAVIQAPEKKAQ